MSESGHPPSARDLRSAALCLFSAALFGAAAPATKRLAVSLDPQLLAALLYAGAAVGVLPWALPDGSPRRGVSVGQVMRVAGACISGGIVAPILLMMALARAPAASVSLWLPLESVWTALLAWLFFREHIDRFTSAALALIVAAGVLLAGPGRLSGGTAAVLAAVACLCWGIDNNLTATIDRLRPAQLTFVKGAVGAAVNLGVSLARGASLPSPPHVLQAIAIGMLGYGASLALYITGSQRLGAARAQLLFATAPLAGVAVAWLGLGEQPLPLQGAASVLTAVAWLLLLRSQHGHLHAHEALEHVHGHRHDDAHHDHEHSGLAPGVWHTHEHRHEAVTHSHAHLPDLHHRHEH